jgi:hypothetical protein
MNRTIASLLTGVLLTGISLAQSSADAQAGASASQSTSVSANKSGAQANSETSTTATHDASVSGEKLQAENSGQLASDNTFQAELVKPIDSRKSKPGDEVVAKTTQDIKSDGQVIVPKGSKLIGRVTEAKAAGKGQSDSQVGIAFDHAVLKNGRQVPMAATIQAISSSQAAASAADNSLMTGADVGGMATASRPAARGALGGVSGGLANTTGAAAGGALNTAHATNATGATGLTSESQGIIGMSGMSLSSAGSSATSGAGVISSRSGNVRLDSGTQMLLRTNR